MNKKILTIISMSLPFFSYAQSEQTQLNVKIDSDIYKSATLNNTPINTGGANYSSEGASGLEEYNLRKNELYRKVNIISEEQAKVRAQKELEMKNQLLKKNETKTTSKNQKLPAVSNSNQSYYDRINNPSSLK